MAKSRLNRWCRAMHAYTTIQRIVTSLKTMSARMMNYQETGVVNTYVITTYRIGQSLPSTVTCKNVNTYRAPKHLSREIHSKSRLCSCDWAPLAVLVFRKRLARTDSQGGNSGDSDRKMARWRFRSLKPRFFPNVAARSPCRKGKVIA